LLRRAGVLRIRRSPERGRFTTNVPGFLVYSTVAISLSLLPSSPRAADDPSYPDEDTSSTQQSQDAVPPPSSLTGEWGGLRTRLRDDGIDLGGNYKAEPATNVEGGPRTSTTTPSDLSLRATLSLEKILSVSGGTFQTSLSYRQGASLPLNLLQQSQEVYGRGKVVRLAELWYQQLLFDGSLTLKLGRMPEGDFNSFPCFFNNNTFCGAPAGSLVSNYWYNWPISGWAGWARVDHHDVHFMVGAHETNPDDLGESFAPAWFHGATGVTAHAEAGWTPQWGASQLQGRYQAGAWYDTSEAKGLLLGNRSVVQTGLPELTVFGRYGYYAQALQQLTGIGAVDSARVWRGIQGVSLFANFVQADHATAAKDNKASIGMLIASPLATRPDDHLGLAFGRTSYNSRAAEAMMLENPGSPVPHGEYTTELYYSYLLLPWLAVRPDVQFIVDPGGLTHSANVVVLGARIVATL
jgi:porin